METRVRVALKGRRGTKLVACLVAVIMAIATMIFVAPSASAYTESGQKACGSTNDHVYTKARYRNGSAWSNIKTNWGDAWRTHPAQGGSWVNRYHQPGIRSPGNYWIGHNGDFSHVSSWPGCE